MKFLSAIVLLLTVNIVCGEVYLLRRNPSSQGGSTDITDGFLHSTLAFEPLFEEKIRINGVEGYIKTGLLDHAYGDFFRLMQRIGSKNVSLDPLTTVIRTTSIDYLIYNVGDFNKAVCFTIDVPRSKSTPPPLPYNCPDPGNNSVHDKVVEFPERNTVYVTFAMVLNAEDAFWNCKSQLESRKFKHIDNGDNSNAGFFLSPDGSQIVLVSFNEKFKNGFVYMKERKK